MNAEKLNKIKEFNPDVEFPSSFGKKWTIEEESQLLDEIERNINQDQIAILHNRTFGGISSRLREIAYKMYIQHIPIDTIILKTKLTKEEINDSINRRELAKKQKQNKEIIKPQQNNEIEHTIHIKQSNNEKEILEIKNHICLVENKLISIESKLDKLFIILESLEVV